MTSGSLANSRLVTVRSLVAIVLALIASVGFSGFAPSIAGISATSARASARGYDDSAGLTIGVQRGGAVGVLFDSASVYKEASGPRWLVAAASLVVPVIGADLRTTAASAATFTYDISKIARVGIHEIGPAEPNLAQPSDAWEWSASPSVQAQGASTTSSYVVATNTGSAGRSFTHFTDEAGATGITGRGPLAVGESAEVGQLSFAKGENSFLSSGEGRNFRNRPGPRGIATAVGRNRGLRIEAAVCDPVLGGRRVRVGSESVG